ncbi:hypothetical protein FHX08_004214 [Rhizobium sp. BK529]|uniref:hypothetical protein n=1 Tax=Rhizobium sp. BK529 TaxID=2586983 RepID=UPI00161F7C37|nr:hypothetical protein [Rhizobium sp. BK529]MBB3593811.1 hypothetical protein [Rhizobium sp. BK529]
MADCQTKSHRFLVSHNSSFIPRSSHKQIKEAEEAENIIEADSNQYDECRDDNPNTRVTDKTKNAIENCEQTSG